MAVTETNIYSRQTSVLPTFKHLNESSNSLQGKFLGLFGTLNILSMIRQEKKLKIRQPWNSHIFLCFGSYILFPHWEPKGSWFWCRWCRGHGIPILDLPFSSLNRYPFTDSYLVFSVICSLFPSLIKPHSQSDFLCHLEVKPDRTTNVGCLKDVCIQTGIKIFHLRRKSNCNSAKR